MCASMSFDYKHARFMMVEGQIRPNRVNSTALLDRFDELPREHFAADGQKEVAYRDDELQAGNGRALLSPMVLARMIEATNPQANDRVLDVAPATGYSTVLLATLVQHVTALEADPQLSAAIAHNCEAFGVRNADSIHGPLSLGAKQNAPYDIILVNGAVTEVPKALFHQLAEGGRLVAVIGGQKGLKLGTVTLFEKFHGNVSQRVLFEGSASYLPGFTPTEEFAF